MENSLPGKGGQHLVCIRLGELRSPEAEWEILLSAGGVGLLGCGSSGADRKEEAKRGRREEETLALPPSLHSGRRFSNVTFLDVHTVSRENCSHFRHEGTEFQRG